MSGMCGSVLDIDGPYLGKIWCVGAVCVVTGVRLIFPACLQWGKFWWMALHQSLSFQCVGCKHSLVDVCLVTMTY